MLYRSRPPRWRWLDEVAASRQASQGYRENSTSRVTCVWRLLGRYALSPKSKDGGKVGYC